MADFELSMFTKPTLAAMKDMEKRVDRATMWALRECGRQVKREARRRAPVYKNPNLGNARLVKALKKAGASGDVSSSTPIPGLLRSTISSSKRFRREGTTLRIGIAPRGWRVNLYAGKIEARTPFMRPAYEAVVPQMVAIHQRAWGKAMK